MFRQLTVILLLIGFAAQSFNLGWLVLDYSANKSSYQQHCENKAKPMMLCHGKCQMYKKLKSEHQKEEQFPETRGGSKIDVLCSRPEVAIPDLFAVEVPGLNCPLYVQSFPVAATIDIFHPPA
jgi:hypothetical protein